MNEQPACMGCYVQALPWTINPVKINPALLSTASDGVGLTDAEKEVLKFLSLAWATFLPLKDKHPDHNDEFRDAIHRCQHIIAIRVARRVDPEIWYEGDPV